MCNQPQTADNGIAIDTIIEKQIDEIADGVHAKNRQDKMGGLLSYQGRTVAPLLMVKFRPQNQESKKITPNTPPPSCPL